MLIMVFLRRRPLANGSALLPGQPAFQLAHAGFSGLGASLPNVFGPYNDLLRYLLEPLDLLRQLAHAGFSCFGALGFFGKFHAELYFSLRSGCAKTEAFVFQFRNLLRLHGYFFGLIADQAAISCANNGLSHGGNLMRLRGEDSFRLDKNLLPYLALTKTTTMQLFANVCNSRDQVRLYWFLKGHIHSSFLAAFSYTMTRRPAFRMAPKCSSRKRGSKTSMPRFRIQSKPSSVLACALAHGRRGLMIMSISVMLCPILRFPRLAPAHSRLRAVAGRFVLRGLCLESLLLLTQVTLDKRRIARNIVPMIRVVAIALQNARNLELDHLQRLALVGRQ